MGSPTFYLNNPSISLSKPWKLENSQFQKFLNSGGGLGGLKFLNYMEILIGMKGLKIACDYIKVIFFFGFLVEYFCIFSTQKLLFQHIKKDFCEKWPYFALFRK
jgi:hypothetical protein